MVAPITLVTKNLPKKLITNLSRCNMTSEQRRLILPYEGNYRVFAGMYAETKAIARIWWNCSAYHRAMSQKPYAKLMHVRHSLQDVSDKMFREDFNWTDALSILSTIGITNHRASQSCYRPYVFNVAIGDRLNLLQPTIRMYEAAMRDYMQPGVQIARCMLDWKVLHTYKHTSTHSAAFELFKEDLTRRYSADHIEDLKGDEWSDIYEIVEEMAVDGYAEKHNLGVDEVVSDEDQTMSSAEVELERILEHAQYYDTKGGTNKFVGYVEEVINRFKETPAFKHDKHGAYLLFKYVKKTLIDNNLGLFTKKLILPTRGKSAFREWLEEFAGGSGGSPDTVAITRIYKTAKFYDKKDRSQKYADYIDEIIADYIANSTFDYKCRGLGKLYRHLRTQLGNDGRKFLLKRVMD